ncbi:hypothetical protein GCM10027596_40210 [Nocardioides korecus]
MTRRIRRQHTVSQFYLKGFANDGGRLSRQELDDGPLVTMSTADASVIKDFYTLELPDGTQSDMFERFFGQFEGAAAEALRAVTAGTWPLPPEPRRELAAWIALQYLRAQEVRSGQGALTAFHIRLVVGASGKAALRSLIESRAGAPISDEALDWEWRDLTQEGGPDLEPDMAEHMRLLVDLLPGLTAHLSDWHWSLLRFERRSLGTSDHPVCLVAAEDHPPWSGVGIATAGMFYMPLTRRLGVTIQPRDRFPATKEPIPDFVHPGTTKSAQSLNQEAARSARRYLFFHPDDRPFDAPVVLPRAQAHGWSDKGAERLISEEGLYGPYEPTDVRPLTDELAWPNLPGRSGAADAADSGVTIHDLPWPIPGRLGVRPGRDELA